MKTKRQDGDGKGVHKEVGGTSCVQGCTPVVLAPQKVRQEDCISKVSLGNLMRMCLQIISDSAFAWGAGSPGFNILAGEGEVKN